MKVLVIGGGEIGCTAAYELASAGHDVSRVTVGSIAADRWQARHRSLERPGEQAGRRVPGRARDHAADCRWARRASTELDETHKVAVTRLGDRIRFGGTADLAGYTLQPHEARRRTSMHVVGDLYPGLKMRRRPASRASPLSSSNAT